MIKLPFKIKGEKSQINADNFLALIIWPHKIDAVYFCVSQSDTTQELVSKPKTELKVICAKSRFFSQDSVFLPEENSPDVINQCLTQLLAQIKQEFSDLPKKVIFGLTPRNCIDLMSLVRYSSPERKRIEEKQVRELYEQAQKNALFRAQDILANQKGDMDTELVLVTSEEVSLELDKTPIRDPIGLEGKELELSWFGSFAESDHLEFLQKIAKASGLEILGVSSLGFSFYSGIKSQDAVKNCVIVDFNFSATSVYVVFGGSLIGEKYIDIGISGLLAEFCQKFSVDIQGAKDLLRQYEEGVLEENISLRICGIINNFSAVWLQALEAVFSDFSGVKTFSSDIFLTGEGFDIPDLQDSIKTGNWYKSVPFKDSLNFIFPNLPPNIVDLGGASSKLEWILPISLGSIYFKMQ